MMCHIALDFLNPDKKGSGSVVECFTQDRGASDPSLAGVSAFCP